MSDEKLLEKLLLECARVGYRYIAIRCSHDLLPTSISYPFNPRYSIFAWGDKQINGFSAIWTIVEKLSIGDGCGNWQQHQIKSDVLNERAVYKRWGKKWIKIYPKSQND